MVHCDADDASTPNGRSPTADMEDDQHQNLRKLSVLAKVKERARKWRNTLSKKRMHSPHHHESNTTPSWGVTLDDNEEDDEHNVEDDSEFFGTPSTTILLFFPRKSMTVCSSKRILTCSLIFTVHEFEQPADEPKETSDSRQRQLGSSSPEASSEKLDGFETAKMNSLTIGVPEAPLTGWEDEPQEWLSPGEEMHWDKGVSVKEYLIEKLKPGEEDRALSQVISDAIRLRKKDTPESLHGKEEKPVHSTTDSMTNFPVSTNPHEGTY